MKPEIKPKVVGQVLGYKIKQMCDSKKLYLSLVNN
jgi:hypothetical protein